MLAKLQKMWDGRLGRVPIAKHRVEWITLDLRHINAASYRAEPKARELEKTEIDKMLGVNDIELAEAKWAAPIVLALKDRSLGIYMNYKKLKIMTLKDAYPIWPLDEFLDSVGEALISLTLDTSSWYWKVEIYD